VPPPDLPPSRWEFPDPTTVDGEVVAFGGDLEPGTILRAYTKGIFPMPLDGRRAWWSPDPRGIIPLDGLKVSRSLRKSCRRFVIRVDSAFDEVIDACGDPARPHGWLSDDMKAAYRRLHQLGWVHSIEAWSRDDGTLAGGLYGVSIGGLFAGESMFHRRTDASKAALVGLVELLHGDGDADGRLLDVQWATDHLVTLGAIAIPRHDYVNRVSRTISLPTLSAFRANIRNRP
jgi:leucyl/phenylalanyl-tRNA---protein transferase